MMKRTLLISILALQSLNLFAIPPKPPEKMEGKAISFLA
jgi:hypothetical protein